MKENGYRRQGIVEPTIRIVAGTACFGYGYH